jgi:hypothetical protein
MTLKQAPTPIDIKQRWHNGPDFLRPLLQAGSSATPRI